MKKKMLLAPFIVGLLLTSCGGTTPPQQTPDHKNSWDLVSGDGSVKLHSYLDENGELYYQVTKNDTQILEPSRLGLNVDAAEFNTNLKFVEAKTNSREISYSNITGKKKNVTTSFNELTLTFKDYNMFMDVIFRTYDDGYSFRYKVYSEDDSTGEMVLFNENSNFDLPDKTNVYCMPYKSSTPSDQQEAFSYEANYVVRRNDRLSNEKIAMPLLYKLNDDCYSLISESDLYGHNYFGSFLQDDGKGTLKTIHAPASTYKTEFEVGYPFTSPWRVGIAGSLGDIVESTLIEDVYDDVEYYKPDNYDSLSQEEKSIYTYNWVDPDVTAWDWLQYPTIADQADWNLHKKYVDLAHDMGWNWVIIDGGWLWNLTPAIMKDFKSYCEARDVKIMAWAHATTEVGTDALIKSHLDTWQKYGIEGLKVDFFDGQGDPNIKERGESQDTIKLYEKLYQETAKRKMLLNCHGGNKPTGERRKYPHVINREAIRGNEMRWCESPQLVIDTFIRGVVGPSDFTPTVYPEKNDITVVNQMALTVLIESGMPSMAGLVSKDGKINEYDNPIFKDFYQELPHTWDDIKFIEGNPDSHAIVARRNGNNWWVAGNTINKKTVTLSFDFLEDGNYKAKIFQDVEGEVRKLVRDEKVVKKGDEIEITMQKNGGLVVQLTKI